MIRILYAEDNADMRFIVKLFLESHYSESEIKVTLAYDALEALKILTENKFDLIISDYDMPGLNGLQFLEKLNNSEHSNVPFILYSTEVEDKDFSEYAMRMGVDFVHKKGGNQSITYMVLVCKICRAIRENRINNGFIEYELTKELISKRLKAPLEKTLERVAKKLDSDWATITIFTEGGDEFMISLNQNAQEQYPGCRVPVTIDEESFSIESLIMFEKSTLGMITLFRKEQFERDDSAFLALSSTYISSMIMEMISRPDGQ